MSNKTPENFVDLDVMRVHADAIPPTRAHKHDAGLDLYVLESHSLVPGSGYTMRTGIAVAIPKGFVGIIADRSSLARDGLKVSGGIIDAGYTGEIHVVMWNIGGHTLTLGKGQRIAQLMLLPIVTPQLVLKTELQPHLSRGNNGFGSSGK